MGLCSNGLSITITFGGGAELLFKNVKKHAVCLPQIEDSWNIKLLLSWLKENMLTEREELFIQNGTVRPGILVLVNDQDWELLGMVANCYPQPATQAPRKHKPYKSSEHLALVLLVVVELGIIHPFYTLGFYCNDPKLSFTDNGETVSNSILLSVSFVLPYFLFVAVEKYLNNDHKTSWIKRSNLLYLRYFHGLCLTFLITDLAKLVVGEPRPHFFQSCKPLEASNCTSGQYFSKYTCTNINIHKWKVVDSYKSFPSGHSSFSCFSAFFMVVYFSQNVRTKSHLFPNILHVLCIFWAMLCSFSRIVDFRHHWWDVLIGAFLGISVAYWFTGYGNLRRNEYLRSRGKYESNDKAVKPFRHALVDKPESIE